MKRFFISLVIGIIIGIIAASILWMRRVYG